MVLNLKPVDQMNWTDLVKLFESKGGPHYCWCMLWRKNSGFNHSAHMQSKKYLLKGYMDNDIPIGLLGYLGNDAICWCSMGPRESFKNLRGDESISDVWSIVCFYVKKEYRQLGFTSQLIEAAAIYAKSNGAKYLEAYPVKKNSPSYRFMGFVPTFVKSGFSFVKKAGIRRNVMVRPLEAV